MGGGLGRENGGSYIICHGFINNTFLQSELVGQKPGFYVCTWTPLHLTQIIPPFGDTYVAKF